MGGATSKIDDQREDEEAYQGHNFDARTYELNFSKDSHINEIEYENQNENDGDPNSRLLTVPVRN